MACKTNVHAASADDERVIVHSRGVVRIGVKTWGHSCDWQMTRHVLTNSYTVRNYIAGVSITNAVVASIQRVMRCLIVRLPVTDEVFPCVDYRDRMHGLLMFLHRVMFTALSELVTKQKHRRILDRRLNAVCAHNFVYEGVSLRRQRSIFTDVGMSATDKVTVLMLLPHVIGPVPDTIFPPRIHVPLATAVARAQLMVLAVRGRRSYTKTELELIFDDGFVVLFGALETLNVERFNVAVRTYNKKLRAGKKTGKKPTPFKKQSRYSGSTISRAGDQSVVSKIKYIVYTENARKFTVLTMNFITICA